MSEYESTMRRIAELDQEAAARRAERDMREAERYMEHLDKTDGAAARLRAELEASAPRRPLSEPGPHAAPEPPPEWNRKVWLFGWLADAVVVIAALQEQLPGWTIAIERTGRRKNDKR